MKSSGFYRVSRGVKRVLLYLLMTVIALIMLGPFLWLLSTSLKEASYIYAYPPQLIPRPLTLESYIAVIKQLDFLTYFLNSVFITLGGISLNAIFSSMAAYPLARFEFPGKKIIFAAMISTMFLPNSAGLIVNFLTMKRLNLVDRRVAVFLPAAVTVFGIFLLRQTYLKIPGELEDAARIDGASEFGIWWRIMLPLSKPALVTLIIFDFVTHWNSFLWSLIILQDPKKYPLAAALQYLQGVFAYDFKLIAAGTVISVIPIIIVFLVFQKQYMSGMAGAVKA